MFTIVPRNVLGGNGYVAPSDQLTKGIVGCGGIGRSSYHFTSDKNYRLVALCDVDSKHLNDAAADAKKRFGETCKTYHDFRDLVSDPSVDVVHVATPPHWHALIAMAAAKAGKDIWCEKPMTRTIGEGRALRDTVKRYNRIFRLNTWFRFTDTFYGLGTTVKPLKKLIDSGEKYDRVITIGPLIMMKFVCKLTKEYEIPTVASMNPIMIDGTGMCGGCRLTVGGETKFACVDGPEFDGHLIDFDQAMARGAMYKDFERHAHEETCNLFKKEVK